MALHVCTVCCSVEGFMYTLSSHRSGHCLHGLISVVRFGSFVYLRTSCCKMCQVMVTSINGSRDVLASTDLVIVISLITRQLCGNAGDVRRMHRLS